MAQVVLLFRVMMLLLCVKAYTMVNEPFPDGSGMASLGTIIYDDGPGGRNPVYPAAYMDTGTMPGGCVSVTTYYDDMDNYQDRRMVSYTGGGWFTIGRFSFKGAIKHFDALGVYFEQTGYISCSACLMKGVRVGVDITGYRMYIDDHRYVPLKAGCAGGSLVIPVKPVIVTASVSRFPLIHAGSSGADPLPVIKLGIHTAQHAFGAQGLSIDIVPGLLHPVNVIMGQEMRLHKNITVSGALANNPFLVGFGISILLGQGNFSAAMVNHPVLGWSRGFAAEYTHDNK